MNILKIIFYIGLLSAIFPVGNYVMVNMIVVTIGLFLVLLQIYSSKKMDRILFNGYTLFISIWFILSLTSYFWVVDFSAWAKYNSFLYIGLSYTFIISTLFTRSKNINGFFKTIMFSLFIHNIIGYFEIFTGQYYFTSNSTIKITYSMLGYPTSFFYNTNDFATFLLLGIIVTVFYLPNENISKTLKKLFNLFRFMLVVSSFYLTIATDSRLIVLISCIVFIMAAYFNMSIKNLKLLMLPLIILFVSYSVYLFTANVNTLARALSEDPSGNTRLILLNNGLDLLVQTNYRGVGAGNLEYYLSAYQQYGVATIYSMHNWWMEVLATYGLLFFMYYLIYYSRNLFNAYQTVVKTKNKIDKICFMWLVAFIPGSVVSSSIFDEVWVWIVNAVIFILLSKTFKRRSSSEIEEVI